ncbi:hypothetical protein F4781DRAFT_65405 [Annulohypoxylon bovei var. microspora]|nr:hypothetical protein F4781DRAFT_65405 [Annulohypoxylon bovei var. microspora]
MFGNSRRHRPPNPHLNSATANPNAASAAATAFMSASNQRPNRSLSSAAAAAALRARPHTPTNVGEVQTKRTMRRSNSVSSVGSASTGASGSRPTAQLQRKGSSGSMTERSFRSPSPHRTGSIHTPEQHPPVPQIPAGHKKSASVASSGVGMQAFRTASQKIKVGHSSWYTEPSGDPSNVRTSDAPMKNNKPQLQKPQATAPTTQRPDSRSSLVNFSYPTAFRAQSPPASPSSAQAPQFPGPAPRAPASPPRSNRASMSSIGSGKSDQQMVYDRNSRRMVPRTTVDNAEHHAKEATEKQPRKKKQSGIQKEGGHLPKGTVARIRGTAVDTDAGERALPKREQPVIEASPTKEESQILEEPAVKAIITTSGQPKQQQEEFQRNQSLQPRDTQKSRNPPPSQSTPHDPSTSSPVNRILIQKPAAVQEPKEISQDVNDSPRSSQKVINALDSVPTRQSIFEQPENTQLLIQETGEAANQHTSNDQLKQTKTPNEIATEKKTSIIGNKPVLELSREGGSLRRSNSNSPARQAHFSATPSDNLAVRHTPLPRSASPIKSALKRTSPTRREVSPSDKSSDMSESRGASPHQQDETTVPRKKSVRVSFDDRTMATVVGESASAGDSDDSAPPSPQQVKRPWYSNIGRSKRREFTLDDDEIMKPRPALPSFGSIREKKTRETGERPLVRPHEPNYSPAIPSSPELRPSTSGGPNDTGKPEELPIGQSSDQAIGSILSQVQTSRNAPNISRFREPLPPVVTSVEGSGYISDSIGSSDSDDLLNSVTGASDSEEIPSTQTTQLETRDNSQNNSTVLEKPTDSEGAPKEIHMPQEVPEIAIIQPSPRVPEQSISTANSLENHYFDVPGGFPVDRSETTRNAHNVSNEPENEASVGTSPSPSPIFEPKAVIHPVQAETLPQTTLSTTTPLDAGDDGSADESSSSIYSDAYEDLSDIEGDGFMSLNAVVEKPINEITPSQLPEKLRNVPKEVDVPQLPQANEQHEVATRFLEPAQGDDWELAKAFWRSLTAEKRHQLEREAMEEAGTEGDEEDVPHPVRRNSNKKKTTQHQQQQQQQQATVETKPQPSKAVVEPILPVRSEKSKKIRPRSQPNPEPVTSQPTSSRMRMSLRADKPGQTDGIRKTMRSHAGADQTSQPAIRRTAQREVPTATSPKPTQHQNATSATRIPSTNRVGSSLPNGELLLQRRGSDASDSSFKRSRATRNGGFGFRNSMRPLSSHQIQDAKKSSGRFSLRSLSPVGSSYQHSLVSNAVGGTSAPAMRHTLRSGSVSSQERALPSIRFPSFGRSSKAPSTKHSKRSSRFGDSSDDDEGGIAGFRSRFDDSSDEDNVRPSSSSRDGPLSRGTLRPSTASGASFRKSTPVPEVDENSPELPDSDDEMPSPLQSPRTRPPIGGAGLPRSNPAALGTGTLTRSRSGRGSFNTSVSAPAASGKERRSSLMGILKRNKKADSASKIQRSELSESAARRDTRLERSSEQLRDIRGDYPSSPKLQKRGSIKRNDSWPLGEPAESAGVKRSNSAGNLLDQGIAGPAVQRPGTSGGRSTSLGLPAAYDDERDNVTVEGLGQKKKKKFGALRRMFGLDN